MNAQYRAQGAPLSRQQRFQILDRIVTELSPGNKVNLMIYDGEMLYVHTNYRASLFRRQLDQGVLFSTHALDEDGWEPVPFTQLLAYHDGKLQFSGTCHGAEYQEDPEQLRLLYLSCAAL
jgi:glutamine amidotransferase